VVSSTSAPKLRCCERVRRLGDSPPSAPALPIGGVFALVGESHPERRGGDAITSRCSSSVPGITGVIDTGVQSRCLLLVDADAVLLAAFGAGADADTLEEVALALDVGAGTNAELPDVSTASYASLP
jgi:hypothetical protein